MNTQLHGYIDTHSTRNQHIQTQSILVCFSLVIWIMLSNLKGFRGSQVFTINILLVEILGYY